MKKTYSNPEIEMMLFTEEEILTDIVNTSETSTKTWGEFIGAENA